MTQGSKTRSATVVPALLVSAVAVWLTGVALSALAPNQAKPAEAAGQPSAAAGAARVEEEFIQAAESAIEQVCRMCHPIENVLRLRRTSREWTDVLTTMAGRGANASDEQFEMIHNPHNCDVVTLAPKETLDNPQFTWGQWGVVGLRL